MAWGHEALQHDLAEARRAVGEIVAERLGLGSYGTHGQMDVVAMRPSWTNPNPTAYEVKVSRPDFHADTQAGKYRRYLPFVRRLYFAAPAGLLSKGDVPEGMGLIVRGANGWSVVKAPRVNQPDPAKWPVLLQSMLMRAHPAPWRHEQPTRAERIARATSAADIRYAGLTLSRRVYDALTAAERTRDRIARAEEDVAHALGESVDGRSLEVLVRLVLGRRPARPGPDLSRYTQSIGYNLDALGRILERMKSDIKDETEAAA